MTQAQGSPAGDGTTAPSTAAGPASDSDDSVSGPAESVLETAAAVGTRTVDGPGGRAVAYAEYGDPDGVPVLFLHGTPGSRLLGAVWDRAARERGVCLLAVDRPGYGQSDPWRGRTLADTGAFVAPVLDDAGVESVGVVGFSGGGPHALALAATHSERVRSVDLVAGAAPPECVESEPRPQRVLGALATRTPRLLGGLLRVQAWVARRGSPSLVVSQYTSGDGDAAGDGVEAVPDDTAELVRREFCEALARSRNGVVTESRLFARGWDVSLDAVECPVRLTHGERDGNVPVDAARRLAERLPDATLSVTDADHLHTLLGSRESVLDAQVSAAE